MKHIRIPMYLALLVALAACGRNQSTGPFARFSDVDDSHVAIHARGVSDAIIAVDGSLRIDDRAVALTPPQQALLRDYYLGIRALRRDALATGAAGIATAGTAIASVVSGLASGDPDSIGRKVDAKAAKVEAAAATLCADIAALRSQQESIASQLAAFQPYAVIGASGGDSCKVG
jgi:hypothetical protein